jgi:hypothetical protein
MQFLTLVNGGAGRFFVYPVDFLWYKTRLFFPGWLNLPEIENPLIY